MNLVQVVEKALGKALTAEQQEAVNAIESQWAIYGDGDNRKLAYILATSKHESNFRPIHEFWGPTAAQRGYEGRSDLGNFVAGDGYKFRGRGSVSQITGRANYAKFSQILGVDLVENPDLALDNTNAAIIGIYGMMHGSFRKHKLSTFINDEKTDYYNARNIINGDKDKHGRSIAANAEKFEKALANYAPQPQTQEIVINPPKKKPKVKFWHFLVAISVFFLMYHLVTSYYFPQYKFNNLWKTKLKTKLKTKKIKEIVTDLA